MPNTPHACTTPREAIRAFIALLERECEVLMQPQAAANADGLEAIAGEKQSLTRALQALCAQAGHAALHGDREFRGMVARARQLNDSNAKLLTMQRGFCESRLHLLRGSDAHATYRANGTLGR
jgi:flagellar biosynthesis/type III secretory pathway chaperone